MEITEEQLNKIFELASVPKKKDNSQITSKDITAALIAIERKIYSFSSELKVDSLEDKKILITGGRWTTEHDRSIKHGFKKNWYYSDYCKK